ncbi:MAG TPA: hypothetical protein VFH51_19855 [Myxococcota bacterium]|nr:hypothetical protein [Myxococcota bacterium]
MNVGPTATKKNVLEQLLEQGMVLVAMNARVEGVDVPAHLGKDPQLRLNLSYRFGLPMSIDDWGVAATLTFAGIPYNCRFPWNAIFLMVSHVSGQPYLFPDDIPPELLTQASGEGGLDTGARPAILEGKATRQPARPKLTLISSAETQAPAAAAAEEPESPPPESPTPPPAAASTDEGPTKTRRPRRRGHLRLVK